MVEGNPELLWSGFFLIKRVSTDFHCIKTEVVITENQSKVSCLLRKLTDFVFI